VLIMEKSFFNKLKKKKKGKGMKDYFAPIISTRHL